MTNGEGHTKAKIHPRLLHEVEKKEHILHAKKGRDMVAQK
jgi:hypothetical protein